MGIKFLPFVLITAIILFSGCTQTGTIINKSTEAPEPVMHSSHEAPVEIPVIKEEPENQTTEIELSGAETGLPATEEGEVAEPADPCEGITCPDSVTICDDDYKARCKNHCAEGVCSICIPNCAGHDIEASEEACELSCGICEDENEETCQCDLVLPCDGNGLCEEGEYPESDDCPDCNDEDGCTEDLFNHTSDQCYHEIIIPCCGNGLCENETGQPENHTSCPSDCDFPEEPPPEEPAQECNITIVFVEPSEEWVEIENTGSAVADMTNWTINDTLSSPKTIFTFPSFMLPPNGHVFVLKSHGEDNTTHLFRNKDNNVWNNDGDTAVLIDDEGKTVSTHSYG